MTSSSDQLCDCAIRRVIGRRLGAGHRYRHSTWILALERSSATSPEVIKASAQVIEGAVEVPPFADAPMRMRFPDGPQMLAREVLPLVLHPLRSCGLSFSPRPAPRRSEPCSRCVVMWWRANIQAPPTFVNDDSLFPPGESPVVESDCY